MYKNLSQLHTHKRPCMPPFCRMADLYTPYLCCDTFFSPRSSDNKLVFLGLDYLGLGGGSSGAPALHRVTAAAAAGDSSSGGSGSTIIIAKAARRALVGDLLLVFDYDSEVGVTARASRSAPVGPPRLLSASSRRMERNTNQCKCRWRCHLRRCYCCCSAAAVGQSCPLGARRRRARSLFTRAPFLRSTRSSATLSLSQNTLEDIMFGRGEREKFRHDERKKRSRCA
jgi:hypothetical protein